MRYRIEYTENRRCTLVDGSQNLILLLNLLSKKEVADIRKVYANGVSDSVLEKYEKYFREDMK